MEQVELPPRLRTRFQVGRQLGIGGRSAVYLAHDPLLRRDVAIKIFTIDADEPKVLRAQQAEARVLASLNHYALTTLFDAGVDATDPDRPQIYLVMEYLPGSDLRARLKDGPLTTTQVCWLGFDLAEGLGYVHDAGFVHHDIKPANVLLASLRTEPRIRGKLADFGIATMVGVPEDGEFTIGTAAYLSPEQVEGDDATPLSDIYSLGLVLLEAATGRVAYPGGIERAAFARLARQPAIPDTVPKRLAGLLRTMTARDPEDRPTLQHVAAEFQSIAVQELVEHRDVDPVLLPVDEAERVAALRRYNILDTPPDDAFDVVTRLAAQLLDVPIAVVSIADTDRVWHKSKYGTDVEQVERNSAFCVLTDPGHGQAWGIGDVRDDARLRDNPFVVGGPNVRSYAAAPLVTRDGHHLGALCVFGQEPRRFQPQELANLTDLASMVMRELELRLSSRRALFDRR